MTRNLLMVIIITIIINVSCQISWGTIMSSNKKIVPLSRETNNDKMHRTRRADEDKSEECRPNDSETVKIVMSRICLLCHDVKSYFAPNTRAECHLNCFKNDVFRSCMKLFSGSNRKNKELV